MKIGLPFDMIGYHKYSQRVLPAYSDTEERKQQI